MKARPKREEFVWFDRIATRWMDNDVYGHVNNVVYYSFFDTAVNRFLIENAKLDIHGGETIGLVVETACRYHAPLGFPVQVEAGVRVARIGNSSVRYEVGIFEAGASEASADGHFVHVYVDRESRRPTPVSDGMRRALETLIRA